MAKKHNLPIEKKDTWNGDKTLLDDYQYRYCPTLHFLKHFYPKTETVLFFPSGKEMPDFIMDTLKDMIDPIQFTYPVYQPHDQTKIICREQRTLDFVALVRFAVSEKAKVKAGTYDMTKAKLVNMVSTIGFEEVYDNDGFFGNAKGCKRISDFKVGLPLFVLAANGGLLDMEEDGTVIPNKQSTALLSLSPSHLVKKLFESYMKSDGIYELHYVPFVRIHDDNGDFPWYQARQSIIAALKTCPLHQWVSFAGFEENVKLLCGNFFRKYVYGRLSIKNAPYDGYTPSWAECETHLIGVILGFLSALGMVDIAYMDNMSRFQHREKDYYVGIDGFRITPLGGWVLGHTHQYEEAVDTLQQNESGRLMVLPDYTVIISGLNHRIEHETYLSHFLTKVSDDTHVAIYKLDLASALRAFGLGIEPKQLKSYLEKASDTPLPDNVIRALDDWQGKTQRVQMKTVTIIETDDPVLMAEIKHIRSMDQIITKDVQQAVIIDPAQQKKAKTLIEKNGWFVSWDQG